jgi:signal-transduction protein with cAMP-binding, CBS, and nucleotidyltransferase domain
MMKMATIIDDTELKKSMLRKQACFMQLTDQEVTELSDLLYLEEFKTGDTIVTQGDFVDKVYLIVEGVADVQVTTIENGKPVTRSVATLGRDQAIGLSETGFYSLSGKRTATVIAKSEMILLAFKMAAFHGFALSHSHVKEVMSRNAQEIRENSP